MRPLLQNGNPSCSLPTQITADGNARPWYHASEGMWLRCSWRSKMLVMLPSASRVERRARDSNAAWVRQFTGDIHDEPKHWWSSLVRPTSRKGTRTAMKRSRSFQWRSDRMNRNVTVMQSIRTHARTHSNDAKSILSRTL